MIYLDYASETPVDSEVLDSFCDATKRYYANPNLSHKLVREAKELIGKSSNI